MQGRNPVVDLAPELTGEQPIEDLQATVCSARDRKHLLRRRRVPERAMCFQTRVIAASKRMMGN